MNKTERLARRRAAQGPKRKLRKAKREQGTIIASAELITVGPFPNTAGGFRNAGITVSNAASRVVEFRDMNDWKTTQ